MTQRSSGALGARYLRILSPRGGKEFAVNRSTKDLLGKVDAVAFDCDGVLIDARRSYDATIRVVVETMVEEMTGVRLRVAGVMPRLIATVRRTGGFNSDWDTTYALTLFALVALEQRKEGRGAKAPGAIEALTSITARFGSAPRERGDEEVDSFLDSEFPSEKESVDKAREFLEYPRTPPDGRMTTAFDELYFGASLFEKAHGVPSRTPRAKGLIELERTLVDRSTLESLKKMLGGARLAMITGRPFVGTEYSLGKGIMGYFDKSSSIFIGDADFDLGLRPEYDRYRKPSPEALIRAKEKLSSETLLYVGDSAEDLMMVQNARRRGFEGFLFAGVYQTSPVQADQASFFEREGSDVVVESVNQVPSGLLLPTKSKGSR
jgi:phosphoglycolate phosphatase-like HAD superfamily hydrolase